MNAAEITDKLGLHSLRQRAWYIQAACATSGDGLYEGLEWVSFVSMKVAAMAVTRAYVLLVENSKLILLALHQPQEARTIDDSVDVFPILVSAANPALNVHLPSP